MQVYRRIANPFMPNGTPESTNSPSPFYAPGELGCAFNDQNTGRSYLRVQLDSGASSATTVGAVAAGQLAFWKDQTRSIVTNDKNFSDGGPSGAINRIAGIFTTAVTAAPGVNGTDGKPVMYMCDLIIRGYQVQVKTKANSALVGGQATADTAANTAQVLYTTGVNTAPVSQIIGVFANGTVDASGYALVDVAVGFAE